MGKLTRTQTYTLPYPPSVNHYWRRVGKRVYLSRRGRRYRKRVAKILKKTRLRTLEGPVALTVELYTPDRRRRDVDNVLKALLDALEHAGVFRDDSQVAHLAITRCGVVAGGKAVVRVEAYTPPHGGCTKKSVSRSRRTPTRRRGPRYRNRTGAKKSRS